MGERFGSSAEGTPLQLPVMGNPMQHINPYYTQQQTDNSLAPMAAYQQFRQTGQMPQQQGGYTSFTPPPAQFTQMQTLSPLAAFAGSLGNPYNYGDPGGNGSGFAGPPGIDGYDGFAGNSGNGDFGGFGGGDFSGGDGGGGGW